jgi:hypothetical protein
MSNQDLIIRLKTEGINTIKQLEDQLKSAKLALKGMQIGSNEAFGQREKITGYKDALKEVNGTAGGLHATYFKLGTLIREVTVGIGTATAAFYIFKKAIDVGEEAARMKVLLSTMQQMAGKDGIDFANVMEEINSKIGVSVSKFSQLQGVMKLSLLDVAWKEIPRVMEFAEKRADLLGMKFEEVLGIMERAVLGGKKAIRQLMIPVDIEQSYKDYAVTLGVTEKELTDVGKQHVLFAEILKKGEEQHLNINKAANDELDKYEKLDTAWKNLGESAGVFATKLSPVVEALASIVEYINALLSGDVGKTYPAIKKKSDDAINAQRAKYGLPARRGTGYVTANAINSPTPYPVDTSVPIPDLIYDDLSADVDWDKVYKKKRKAGEDFEKWQEDMEKARQTRFDGKEKAKDAAFKNEERRQKRLNDLAEEADKAELKRLKKIAKENDWLIHSMSQGVRSVGADIDTWIYGAWERSIGGAKTLFGGFVISVLQGLAQIATELLMLQMISWFLPSFGSIGNVAKALGRNMGGGLAGGNDDLNIRRGVVPTPSGGSYAPSIQIIPIATADQLNIMVKISEKKRQGRVR